MTQIDTNVYGLIADVLEYPGQGTVSKAEACSNALRSVNGKAQVYLETFSQFCHAVPLGRLEELYTNTFDLEALCSPYVGFHLFGEDRVRGMFMVKLKEHYLARGHSLKGELPDHITIMLRSLASPERNVEASDLISYCLIPALKKMVHLFKDDSNPYRGVVEAALAVLEQERTS